MGLLMNLIAGAVEAVNGFKSPGYDYLSENPCAHDPNDDLPKPIPGKVYPSAPKPEPKKKTVGEIIDEKLGDLHSEIEELRAENAALRQENEDAARRADDAEYQARRLRRELDES